MRLKFSHEVINVTSLARMFQNTEQLVFASVLSEVWNRFVYCVCNCVFFVRILVCAHVHVHAHVRVFVSVCICVFFL